MRCWKNKSVVVLAGIVSGCSGSSTGQAADVSAGGTATSGLPTGGVANGGSSVDTSSNQGGVFVATSTESSMGGAAPNGGTTAGSGTTAIAGTSGAGNKRGIAANVAPGAAFYPAVGWWYNWAAQSSGTAVGIEFVPMIWNATTVSSTLPSGSKFVLGFNEPNFFVQANLSATQAARDWQALQTNARSSDVRIVSPAVNFCGPKSECHDTDPYQYLKAFFAACTDCQVDYIAVHWYNCDLPSLRDYLEPGGNLEGFEQFGKPIWLTEFSCGTSASVAEQEAYLRAAIPYLESNPKVYRYSWFSAGPIPNAKLVNDDGSPTALGRVYISLPHG
jgi:hypothetical protein